MLAQRVSHDLARLGVFGGGTPSSKAGADCDRVIPAIPVAAGIIFLESLEVQGRQRYAWLFGGVAGLL